MAAGSIVIDLLLRTGSFETDTKRAEKRLAELKKEATAMGVAVGAAFTAVAAASVAMVKSSIDAADEASKTAQKIGLSVEALTALQHAANLSDVSNEELTASLSKLSKAANEQSEAFEKMGISVTDAQGNLKPLDTLLGEVADWFQKTPDGITKTTTAMELFSKSGYNMIPMLNGGSKGMQEMMEEAKTLGLVLTTDTGKAAEEFNDNLTRMAEAGHGVANMAMTALLPALGDVSRMLVDAAKNEEAMAAAADVVASAVRGVLIVFQTLVVLGSDVAFVFQGIGRDIGAMLAQLDALGSGDLAGFNAISEAVKADAARARKELDDFQRRIMSLGEPGYKDPRLLGSVGSIASQTAGWGARPPSGGGKGRTTGGGRTGRETDPNADFNRYMDRLRQQIRGLQELSAEETLVAELRDRGLKFTPAQEEQLKLLARTIDADKEHKTVLEEKRAAEAALGDAVNKSNEAYQDRLKALTDDTPVRRMEQLMDDLKFLDEALANGLDQQVYEQARQRLVGLTETAKETKSIGEEIGLTFTSALEDIALAGGDVGDVMKALLKDVIALYFRLTVTEPLLKAIKSGIDSGGDGGGGGFMKSLVGSIAGAFTGTTGGGKASGGDVLPSHEYVVGEFGPERFRPRTAGTIVPAAGMPAAGGLHIINQTTGRVDRASEQRISPTDRAIVLQENLAAFRAELYDAGSKTSKAMTSNFTTSRRR